MWRPLILLTALLAPATTVIAQEESSVPMQGALPAANPDRIVLRAGDLLQVQIWREPDLSGNIFVDESGIATFPMLGPRQVAGIPFGEVRDSLLSSYNRELNNPSIVIVPLRRMYVLGEVNAPGLKTVDPTVSLAGAVALAGGANPQGDLRKIRIVREGSVLFDEIEAERALSDIDLRSGDQVFIGRRSWFDRNSTFVVSALLSVTSIIISLAR